jgi:uncharacterized membrane protein YgaE (UPF0421/DUF939 family)
MSPTLTTRAADFGLAATDRLRSVVGPIAQTSVAAGLAWYFTHDVLGHRQPFFAPIAAVVCLSATNVLRGQRAVQMIIGGVLGIGLGAGSQALLGAGPIAVAGAVSIALGIAVLIGRGFIAQGLMFVNQTAISAVLVVVFPHNDLVVERLFDTVVGGGLAIVFAVLLFPANPMTLLCDARVGMLAALHDALTQIADIIDGRAPIAGDWPLSVVEQLHQQSAVLAETRITARHKVRVAPRRWAARNSVRDADRQAAHLGLLASSVLHLARVVGHALNDGLPQPIHIAIGELAAATAAVDNDPASAVTHAAAARRHAADVQAAAHHTGLVVAAVVKTCADDLQLVIEPAGGRTPSRGGPDLPSSPLRRGAGASASTSGCFGLHRRRAVR